MVNTHRFKLRSVLMALLFAALIPVPVCAQDLAWELAVLKWEGSGYQSLPFRQPVRMASGDTYQIYLKSDSPGYCYLIKEEGDWRLSFVTKAGLYPGGAVFFPDAEGDFSVPAETGTTRFHVIISVLPRENLEKLISRYTAGSAPAAPAALDEAIMDEVLEVRGEISTIREAPEKPVAMGGVARGGTDEAYRFEGQDVYVKTITIRY